MRYYVELTMIGNNDVYLHPEHGRFVGPSKYTSGPFGTDRVEDDGRPAAEKFAAAAIGSGKFLTAFIFDQEVMNRRNAEAEASIKQQFDDAKKLHQQAAADRDEAIKNWTPLAGPHPGPRLNPETGKPLHQPQYDVHKKPL